MIKWLVKQLPEFENIVIVVCSDGVKDTSVKAKDLTTEAKAKPTTVKT